MSKQTKVVPLNFRVTEEFRREVKQKAAKEGKSLQEVGIKLFSRWVNKDGANDNK